MSDLNRPKKNISPLREGWAAPVRAALEAFLETVRPGDYAVFDFDNSCAVFDLEEQTMVYQLRHMAFALTPEALEAVLLTGLPDPDADRSSYGFGGGSFRERAADIRDAYGELFARFGPFTPEGLGEEDAARIEADPVWQGFAARMRSLYRLVWHSVPTEAACPWIGYWFTGMTQEQVYRMALRSHREYMAVPTRRVVWRTPDTPSRTGAVEMSLLLGISVTENVRELMAALRAAGVAVWVCSASYADVIRAGIDAFGLHGSVTGLMAMDTRRDENGRYLPACGTETSRSWLTGPDGAWLRDSRPIGAQTEQAGKSAAIRNVLLPRYGRGPAAGFMDSDGDFDFCTGFDSLRLVVCFNRADRGVRDGGGIIAAMAESQRVRGFTLPAASAAGETLYVLQGRDENGLRSLRPSCATVKFGETEERLFGDGELAALSRAMTEEGLSSRDAARRWRYGERSGDGE